MKNLKFICLVMIIVTFSLCGCREKINDKNSKVTNTENSSIEKAVVSNDKKDEKDKKEENIPDKTLTAEDIDDGIEVVKKALDYFVNRKWEELNKMLFSPTTPSNKLIKELNIIRISYPCKYTCDYDLEDTFKWSFNKIIFKNLKLYAEFKLDGKKYGIDFLLYKETPESDWMIYTYGY